MKFINRFKKMNYCKKMQDLNLFKPINSHKYNQKWSI